MTSRPKPKKKRPTDDDPDDDMPGGPDPTITLIGTRFETEEETAKMTRRQREEVNKDKYVPIYKQELKDERGRKVLPQGAFKGGRVAGFNNTVGSKEGWAPTQFVSSRSNRAGSAGKQATDFMDEEDFEEMGLGAKDVSAVSDFDTFGSGKSSKTGGLEDLITPAKDSVGVRLLRLMGWREGHGIGPRKKKTAAAKKKGYGVALPPGVEREDDSDDELISPLVAEVGVAPKNTKVMEFAPKDDHFGLGYDQFSMAPEFRALKDGRSGGDKQKERQRMRMGVDYSGGSDFGMSVLEGGGSGFNVYDTDNRSEYSRVIEDEPQYNSSRMDFDSKKGKLSSLVATEFGEDGRPIMPGFIKANRVLQQQKFFPPPEVPRDFDPRHRPASVNAESRLAATAQGPQYQITPDQRGELLGEQPLKRSVFDLLSKEDRERLQKIGGAPPTSGAPPTTGALAAPNVANEALAKLGIKVNRFASSGTLDKEEEKRELDPTKPLSEAFGPFRFDKDKQKRYDLWLKVQRGEELRPENWPDNLTPEERAKEHDEFARVWGKFKPLSEAMAKRFKSANVMLGNEEYNEKELVEYQTDVSVQADAAKMKMFGALTRSAEEWRPSGLLCKRFNIMNPYKGTQDWQKKKDERKAAIDVFMEMELPQFMPDLVKPKEDPQSNNNNNADGDNNENNDKKDEDNEDNEEIQEEEKPSIDLFKAIFEDSDEEEESENEEKQDENNDNKDANNIESMDNSNDMAIEEKNNNEGEKLPPEEKQPEKTEEELRAELKEDLIKEREERLKSKFMKPIVLDDNNDEEDLDLGLKLRPTNIQKKKEPIVAAHNNDIASINNNNDIKPVEEEKNLAPKQDAPTSVQEDKEEVIGPELPPTLSLNNNSGLPYIMPMNIVSSSESDSSSSEDKSKRKQKDKRDKKSKDKHKDKHKKSKKRKHKDKKDKKDKHKKKKQRVS